MKADHENRFHELAKELTNRLNEDGFWTGELSSSALGVAVAIVALHFDNPTGNKEEIARGLNWLLHHVNPDGSFGDTPESPGNISTTLLVYAAIHIYAPTDPKLASLQQLMVTYLSANAIDMASWQPQHSILAHYGQDYTFSVPILTLCALCGIPGNEAFTRIPQLPFELTLLPRRLYRLLNLSVVSYAVPALVAVGIVIFKKKRSNYFWRWIRKKSIPRALRKLEQLLPESGGFLEAIPLTAFVALSLIGAGYPDSVVVQKGITFLKKTQRPDGGWPIDVDLSTWVTTLSIKALRNRRNEVLSPKQSERVAQHLIAIQNRSVHPFNGTGPGGWGWTNFTGSVPDCDDTPGAILALLQLQPKDQLKEAVLNGCKWLFQLQNSDGGFPTFSRGWGKLPFDQSCADLTGHCLLALHAALKQFADELRPKELKSFRRVMHRAIIYLEKHQRPDGSWLPLWFGNQMTLDHSNPVYGTARVLTYLQDMDPYQGLSQPSVHILKRMIAAGTVFLQSVRNSDGSWGGDRQIKGSVEETALALSALISGGESMGCHSGFQWLDQHYREKGLVAAPVGLYFASLWYDEKMYPLTAYLEALSRATENDIQEI